ncbi:uncharacterized protein FMAN_16254 [Fusarium mangiferae]|uniref:Uncharacterized protein n=1 Tax=Fusarium mangiferae TaxID=192010 RepID=A0A1L7UID5_FUSMA|nr:uncharacterized protein FMAN_16254 [Fusarium mangiferae]CVL08163.1 uncharacterized protein FMAN_16254 [Fusarium mangiferae]
MHPPEIAEHTGEQPFVVRCHGYEMDGKCQNCTRRGDDCVFWFGSASNLITAIPVSALSGCVPPGTQVLGTYGQPLTPDTISASSPSHPTHQHSAAPPRPANCYAFVQSPTKSLSPYVDARSGNGSQLVEKRRRLGSDEQDHAYRPPPQLSAVDENRRRRSPAEYLNHIEADGVGCRPYGDARQIPQSPASGCLPQVATATTNSYAVPAYNGRSSTGYIGSSGASTLARQEWQPQGGDTLLMCPKHVANKSDIDKTMIGRLDRPAFGQFDR